MRLALDTNILAYAEGVNGSEKKRLALELVQRVPRNRIVLPVQALGELFRVMVGKAHKSPSVARAALLSWQDSYAVVETSAAVMMAAAELAADHHLGIWDAVMLSAAAGADCRLLLSEDMQDGFTWSGVTITNPFSVPVHPLLAPFLASGSQSD